MNNVEKVIDNLVVYHLYTMPHINYVQLKKDLKVYANLSDKDIQHILWRISKGDW